MRMKPRLLRGSGFHDAHHGSTLGVSTLGPSKDAIKARYYTKFSAGGKLPEEQEEEETLGPAPAPAPAPAPEKSPTQSPRRCARLSPGKS